jgi:glycosyltransferase involved in cell wall biosynthesis
MTRLRVAFLAPHMKAGGAERAVLNWLGALDRQRFDPLLILRRAEGEFLPLLPSDVPVMELGGARALLLPARLARLLKEERVEAVYSITNAMNLALLRTRTRATRLVSEHTPTDAYLAEAKWPALRRALIRFLYLRADRVLVPTDVVAATVRRASPRSRVAVLPNPLTGGEPLPARRERNGTPHIVAAGRLVPAKGFELLIDAAREMHDEGADFTLTIYGEGPLRAPLQARIETLDLADRVRLAGHSADLPQDLRSADLFVLSSLREGFGNVIIEAQAAGVPVLATRCGGPETIIDDGKTGFLVPAGSSAALARAMLALLADPSLGEEIREPAFASTARYGIDISTRTLDDLLLEAVHARQA